MPSEFYAKVYASFNQTETYKSYWFESIADSLSLYCSIVLIATPALY